MVSSYRLSFSLIGARKSHSLARTSLPKSNELLDLDLIRNAHQVFDEIPELNVISATVVIGRFVKQNRYVEASYSFKRLLYLGIKPNEFTFGTILGASTSLRDLKLGRQLHGFALKMGLASNVFVGCAVLNCYVKLSTLKEARRSFNDTKEPNVVSHTSLMCGYLKNHEFEEALSLFRAMPERTVVSWNSLIGGFSQEGRNEEAVNTFVDMLKEGLVLPDESTFPCTITAISNIASQGLGQSTHACAIKFLGNELDVFVGNSLISFYSKCGNMEDSLLVFNKLQEHRNIISWNSIIWGYAHNGKGREAIALFEEMNLKPNNVTILGLLFACSHAGLINEGYMYFKKLATENNPNLLEAKNYACMVDMLSRSGYFKEAEELIQSLGLDPGIGFWKALLGGCQIHSNDRLGEVAAAKILEMDPKDVSSYVMISNAYSAAAKWRNVSEIRRKMKEMELKRVPGCSWVEIRGKVCVFVNGDKKNDLKDEVYGILTLICSAIDGRRDAKTAIS